MLIRWQAKAQVLHDAMLLRLLEQMSAASVVVCVPPLPVKGPALSGAQPLFMVWAALSPLAYQPTW